MRSKPFLAIVSAATLLFSALMPSVNGSTVLAATNQTPTVQQSPIEKMMHDYNVSLDFIEGELNKGYFITDIEKALEEHKKSGKQYQSEIQKIRPLPSHVKKDRGPVITPGPTLTNQDQTTALQQSATSSTITPADTTTVDPNPIDLNKTIKQAPYTVPDASYSTLNGAVLGEYSDLAIPGKNGFGFTLKREYDSSNAQLYDVDYSTSSLTTRTKYDNTVSMLGLGWRWAIPSIEIRNGIQVHMADGGVYSTTGTTSPYTLSGYQWKDITFKADSSVATNGYYLISTKDHVSYYFNSRGQLVKMKDMYGNYVSFKYAATGIDPVTYIPLSTTPTTTKLPLSEIDTSSGNKMSITYCSTKTTTAPCNSKDQQVIIQNGDRSVVYTMAQSLYSTGNNMLLLASVTQAVDSKTSYQTQYTYWSYSGKSYTGSTYKVNPYALLKRIVYPTGATSNFTYTGTTLINYTSPTSTTIASQNDAYEMMETYKTLGDPGSDVDPQIYDGEKYDRATLNFHGWNMTSLNPADKMLDVTESFKGVIKNYGYQKNSYNKVPFFVANSVSSNNGKFTTKTVNTYSQKKDDTTTTVTTYPNPNLVTSTIQNNTDPSQTLTYYNNTTYTDYGEIRDQAATSTNAPPLNDNIHNEYDTTNHWLTSTTECLNSNESLSSCTNKKLTTFTHDAKTGATTNMTVQDVISGKNLRQEKYIYAQDANGVITGNLLEKDIQDGAGNNLSVTTYTYDNSTAVLKSSSTAVTSTDPATGHTSTSNVSKLYDIDSLTGALKSITDGNGNTTSYKYDNLGRVTNITYPDLAKVDLSYNVKTGDNYTNVTYSSVDPVTSNQVTYRQEQHNWDTIGNQIGDSVYDPKKGIFVQQSGSTYDYNSRVISESNSIGVVTKYELDGNGRKTKATHNFNGATNDQLYESFVYDDVHLSNIHTDMDNHISQTKYDLSGNSIEVDQMTVDPSTNALSVSKVLSTNTYDLSGNVLTATDANGNQTKYQYDAMTQLTSVKTPDSVETDYAYDTRGLLYSTYHPSQAIYVNNVYDELGRLVQKKDGTNSVTKYAYDGNGNMISQMDRKGQFISFKYDSRNRLLQKAAGSNIVSYSYDGIGHRLSMTDNTGTTKYAYTYIDLIDHISLPDGLTTSFQYDPLSGSLRTGVTDPFGLTTLYQKDNLDRITKVSLQNSTTPEAQYTYSGTLYHTLTEGNNTTFTNTYDQLNHLTNLAESNAAFSTTYAYTYDNNGNIITKTDNVGDYAFSYDSQNRIKQQTLGDNSDTYSYDDKGNRKTLTSSSTPMMPQTNAYEYDGWNQLTRVTTLDGKTVTYRYDGDGLLYERTDEKGTTRYYYDDNKEVIADATATNNTPTLNAHYIRGASNQLITRQAADGTKAYYSLNSHGDVTELRDSNGAVLNSYYYDIWGNPTTVNETVENPFQYSGELWDSVSNLQYLRSRWYDPSEGRFINEDTVDGNLSDPLSLNLYTYANNNPLTNIDPSGHKQEPSDGGGGGGGGVIAELVDLILIDDEIIAASDAGTADWVEVNEAMSAASREYQEQITGTSKVWLQNGVKFDGIKDGVLIEAKGSYSNFVDKITGGFYGWFKGAKGLVDQAKRQIAAARGMPIKWYFSDEKSLNATKSLFRRADITGIQFIYKPMR